MPNIEAWDALIAAFIILIVAANLMAIVRILRRMGYSGWWSLISFLPVINVIGLWVLSRLPWPNCDRGRNSAAQTSSGM